jgi:DNA end-binding protein Ku
MPRSIWNGVISFGMVSIPVKLYSATENKDISFHQIHDKCKTRIREQKYCPHCDRKVEYEELEKGYEYGKGQYITISKEDLEALPLPAKHTIEVSSFVKLEEIDPIYFEKSYYLEPDEAAMRPFALFMKAIIEKGMIGIGTIAIRNKERLCALRAVEGTLVMETLLYPDEVRIDFDAKLPKVDVSAKELKMAQSLIDLMASEFDPEEYKDHYRNALKKVIEAKLEGQEIEVPRLPTSTGKVVDLMEALRVSVENVKTKGKATTKAQTEVVELEPQEKPKRRKTAAASAKTAKTAAGKKKTATRKTSRKKSA